MNLYRVLVKSEYDKGTKSNQICILLFTKYTGKRGETFKEYLSLNGIFRCYGVYMCSSPNWNKSVLNDQYIIDLDSDNKNEILELSKKRISPYLRDKKIAKILK